MRAPLRRVYREAAYNECCGTVTADRRERTARGRCGASRGAPPTGDIMAAMSAAADDRSSPFQTHREAAEAAEAATRWQAAVEHYEDALGLIDQSPDVAAADVRRSSPHLAVVTGACPRPGRRGARCGGQSLCIGSAVTASTRRTAPMRGPRRTRPPLRYCAGPATRRSHRAYLTAASNSRDEPSTTPRG